MSLRVTNTLTDDREHFEPIDEDTVLMYVCGLTTSDPPHLGHARLWVHADVMHRWLAHEGYDVRHVENFTDVNEKIVARVGEDGDSEAEVARGYIAEMFEAMRALNVLRVDAYPRVSGHIEEIVEMVETLLERGYAYEVDGSVYFDVREFDDYGRLSNQSIEEIEAAADPDELAEKRHPADFALWKAGGVDPEDVVEHRHDAAVPPEEAVEAAQTWDSPWGEGRPGWHIECSAMSTAHLGDTFDIHVAGRDIVFPHNDNEIAQSEAATGETFARYWLHAGLLETDDEKMSSSLGNFTTVPEAVEEYGPNVLRTFYLSAVYSARQTYSTTAIEEAQRRYERLQRAWEAATEACDSPDASAKVADGPLRSAVAEAEDEIVAAMNDDFNTREALSALLSVAGAVNRHLDEGGRYDFAGLADAVDVLEEYGEGVFGLSFGGTATGEVAIVDDLIELVLSIREDEREAGNYDRADELRSALGECGIEVQDTDEGPTYRR